MRDRRKRKIVITVLFSLLVCMFVGYAAFNTILSINNTAVITGTWDIYIESITPVEQVDASSVKSEVGLDRISATFDANITAPKGYVKYKVVVKNAGNMDVVLKSVDLIEIDESSEMSFSHDAIENSKLYATDVVEFNVMVKYNGTTMPEKTVRSSTTLMLNFKQNDGSTIPGTTPIIETSSNCFYIDTTYGNLLDYDNSCGSDVVIPREVDGKAITDIPLSAFLEKNIMIVSLYESATGGLIDYAVVIEHNNPEMIRDAYEAYNNTDSSSDYYQSLEDVILYDELDALLQDERWGDHNVFTYPDYFLYNPTNNEITRTNNSTITSLNFNLVRDLRAISGSLNGTTGDATLGECGEQTEGTCSLGTLRSVDFGSINKLTYISATAFQNNQLTEITIPQSVRTIGDNAFAGNNFSRITIDFNSTNLATRFNERWTTIGFPSELMPLGPKYDCYTVNETGETIVAYDATCGTVVSIPNEINGVEVTIIAPNVFSDIDITELTYDNRIFSNRNFNNKVFNTINIYNSTFTEDSEYFAFSNSQTTNLNYYLGNSSVVYGSRLTGAVTETVHEGITHLYGGLTTNLKHLNLPSTLMSIDGFGDMQLETLELPDSLKQIGQNAFINNQLTEVTMGNNIINIGRLAFENNQIESITIPDSVEFIGERAFKDNGLTSLTLGSGVKKIEKQAFIGNNISNELIFDSSLTNIGDNAFSNNPITGLTFNNSPAVIGKEAFINTNLDSLSLGENIVSIGQNTFQNSTLSGNITLPNSITSIGANAFKDNQIIGINIPTSLTTINDKVFENNLLTTINIPNNITTIKQDAFFGNQIGSLTIPDSVTSIGMSAFKNNQIETLTIGSGLTTINHYTFENNLLQTFVIPNTITTINSYAFNNNLITSITIPTGTTYLGYYSFANNNFSNINIEYTPTIYKTRFNERWTDIGFPSGLMPIGAKYGCFYLNEVNATIGGFDFEDQTCDANNIVIPSTLNNITVTGIEAGAFGNLTTINNLTIPSGMTTINSSAFTGINTINNLNISNGVTTIADGAFDSVTTINNLTIPTSVTTITDATEFNNKTIGTLNIANNSNLTNTTFTGSTVDTLNVNAGNSTTLLNWGFASIDNLNIPLVIETIPSASFATMTFDTITMYANTGINTAAFTNSNVTTFNINAGTTTVVRDYGLATITNLNIGEGVTSTFMAGFRNDGIVNVSLPSTLTTLGAASFMLNDNLTSITLPSRITVIPSSAFSSTGLTSITIPYTVTSIASNAFSRCPNLTSVTFEDTVSHPSQLTTLYGSVFVSTALVDVVIPSSVTTIQAYAFNTIPTLNSITIKRVDSTGMTLGTEWNGTCTNIIFAP